MRPTGASTSSRTSRRCCKPGEGSGALAAALLDEERVATVPGVAFGHDTHLRLSYATSDDVIDEGLGRIQRFFAAR